METPSSINKSDVTTRSQVNRASSSSSSTITANTIVSMSVSSSSNKARHRNVRMDRSALFDITNDSPIVGLAIGGGTPPASSVFDKKRQQTPGSGEALLRGQVKIMLQNVMRGHGGGAPGGPLVGLKGIIVNSSPSGLLAPTPTNTPEIEAPPQQEYEISQEIDEPEKSDVTRALLFESEDISSEFCCSASGLTQGSVCGGGTEEEEDDASVWSIQVNTSMCDEDENDVYNQDCEEDGLVDELCDRINRIFVQKKNPLPDFRGKHTRFLYSSDGEEIQGEEIVYDEHDDVVTPQGKHLNFLEEEEEDE